MSGLQLKRRGERVKISGELTIYHATELKNELRDLIDRGNGLLLDLSEVSEFDTAGFQVLAWARREAERRGLALRIEKPSASVQQLFAAYRIDWLDRAVSVTI